MCCLTAPHPEKHAAPSKRPTREQTKPPETKVRQRTHPATDRKEASEDIRRRCVAAEAVLRNCTFDLRKQRRGQLRLRNAQVCRHLEEVGGLGDGEGWQVGAEDWEGGAHKWRVLQAQPLQRAKAAHHLQSKADSMACGCCVKNCTGA